MEDYIVFYLNGKEIGSYTVKGTFAGELNSTIELLAADHNTDSDNIRWKLERR